MFRRLLTWPFRATVGWISDNPIRVTGAVAAAGSAGYLYGIAATARATTAGQLWPALVDAATAHPAYAALVAVGVLAFVALR